MIRHVFTIVRALSLSFALAACGAPDDGPSAFPNINTENPSHGDLIAACMFDQYTYTEAECACGADHAMKNYSLNLRRALVMDNSRKPNPTELQLLASLEDDEVKGLAMHSLRILEACAGRPKPD